MSRKPTSWRTRPVTMTLRGPSRDRLARMPVSGHESVYVTEAMLKSMPMLSGVVATLSGLEVRVRVRVTASARARANPSLRLSPSLSLSLGLGLGLTLLAVAWSPRVGSRNA